MSGVLAGKVVEDVTGRAETSLVIDGVNNHTSVGVVRCQNILNLKMKNIYILELYGFLDFPTDISLLG